MSGYERGTIVLVRHGQTAVNREGRLLGRFDPPLDDTGHAQALGLARALAPLIPADARLVTSPLLRTRQTAEAIAEQLGATPEIEERLVEVEYGALDGTPLGALPADMVQQWHTDASFAPPGGESLAAVQARVAPWAAEQLDTGRTVVAVSHVSPIKAAVLWALGVGELVSWRMRLDVVSVSVIGLGPDGPVLLGLNETLVR